LSFVSLVVVTCVPSGADAVACWPLVSTTQGDEFAAFYASVGRSAARYARAVLGRAQAGELEDVLQEAWAKAWRSWPSADPTRREAWLFRIVRNCCLDHHRRQRPNADRDLSAIPGPEFEGPLIDRLEAGEAVELLDALRPPLREALYLRAVEERSYDEIASILDIPIGTVMSRLHAARKKLAKELR
jgi:RNA polymerase sigma-70 factor, ECF subfamily